MTRVTMRYQTLTAILCTLVLLRETKCRVHRRHHHRDEIHTTNEEHKLPESQHAPRDHLHLKTLDEDELQSRQEARQRQDELLALEHSERVSESGTCDVPKPQVVHVSDHYPGRYFLPHCTVLHRCGRHSGCCGSDHLRCVSVEHQKVVLPFFSVFMVEVRPGGKAVRRVEKLEFTNHTKCGCALDPKAATRYDL
ncbi:hypothetical protein JTE90_020099 [Oedothorax gibbosus]|uniref:Platelet-derived growth factor (PDGF) family profile domain-containing protein n=1 Tax=Oedothorax gibbosus TaxID=931172 RepID=A0AAV6VQ06_9ARAC|nr:hypothetical protein JTE90_020099 [Oedothorax gibbosus]